RVANIIEPVTRDFLISSRSIIFAKKSIAQRRNGKCKRSQWGDCISPKSPEARQSVMDRQSRFGSKSFEQYLRRTWPSEEPRDRCRIVKHAVQIIILLRIKAP